MKSIISSANFVTIDGLLKTKNGEETPINSEWFINREGKALQNKINDCSSVYERNSLINDFARTLKAIIKQEMLEEMRERIDNIETFYH